VTDRQVVYAAGFLRAMANGPLAAAAAMKIAYDWLLFAAFRKVKPPEEEG
jgi:hypothetical protein